MTNEMKEDNFYNLIKNTFFSAPNAMTWHLVKETQNKNSWSNEVMAWINDHKETQLSILPFFDVNKNLTLYIFIGNKGDYETILTELDSFIGQSWATFDRKELKKISCNRFEEPLVERFSGKIFCIGPVEQTDYQNALRDNISIYRGVNSKKPNSKNIVEKSFGNLKREFDKALYTGNYEEAEKKYQLLLTHGRLSHENRLFLKIRKFAGTGLWTELFAQKSLFEDATKLKLPKIIRSDLIQTFYLETVSAHNLDNLENADFEFDLFKKGNPKRFSGLFNTRQNLTTTSALKSFIFWQFMSEDSDKAVVTECIEILKNNSLESKDFILNLENISEEIINHSTHNINLDNEGIADLAFDEVEYEKAFKVYSSLDMSNKILGRMIHCLDYLRTPEALTVVVKKVDAWRIAGNQLPEKLEKRFDDLNMKPLWGLSSKDLGVDIKNIKEKSKAIDGWIEWSRALNSGVSKKDLLLSINNNSTEWDKMPLKSNLTEIESFAENILKAEDKIDNLIDEVELLIIETFLSDQNSIEKRWKPIYRSLFDIKVYRESRSDDDREIARILLSAIISSGVNENEYTDVVDCVKELIDQDLSFSTIEWVMDVCEVLSTGNTANQNKKNEFLSYVLSIIPIKGQAHRFNKAQLLLIKQLCLDIRQEDLFSLYEEVNQSLEEEITLDLAGKLIAIYTLTESAGLRAKKIIETLFQGSKVTLNSDHVETDRLKQLAKNSDFFVFASKSSTHQAYYAAKKYHPRDLLMPTGKGSASIVSKIMELQN